jgi:hypothetical protein
MVILPTLAVAFAGIAGNDTRAVDRQIQSVFPAEVHVQAVKIPAPALRTLTRHGEGSREIVRKLHVDGLVGGELIAGRGGATLRIVIYDADGGLKSLNELPLAGHRLNKDELEVVRSNMSDDITALAATSPPVPPPTPPAPPPAAIRATPPPERPKPAPKSQPSPEPVPSTPEPKGAAPPEPAKAAAPIETADAVGIDEIEAAVGGGGGAAAPAPVATDALHLGAAVGLGVTGRSFEPGPAGVRGYASSPVPAVRFVAEVQPTAHTGLAVTVDRTLQMATPVEGGMAPTAMSRWELVGRYLLTSGAIRIGPELGMGRRTFAIDSTDPSRSPDGEYNYVIVGAAAAASIGDSLHIRGSLAFEPVVSGLEPTEAALGEASRWAFDLGVSVELRLHPHVFVRATADYQRFAWSWDMAGARGAGGAVDGYPTGAVAVGADY